MDSPHEHEPRAPDIQGSSAHAPPNLDTHTEQGAASNAHGHAQARIEQPGNEMPNDKRPVEQHENGDATAVDLSKNDEATYERIEQALRASNDNSPAVSEQGNEPAANLELADVGMQAGVLEDQGRRQITGDAANDSNNDNASSQQLEPHAIKNVSCHNAPQNPGPSSVQFATEAAEALRGNPYMLAASVGAVKKEPKEEEHGIMDGDQVAKEASRQDDAASIANDSAPHIDALREQETSQQAQALSLEQDAANNGDLLDQIHPTEPDTGHEEEDHEASGQESECDSVISDGEDLSENDEDDFGDEEHIAHLRSSVQQNTARAQSIWAQRGNLFRDDLQFEGQSTPIRTPQAHPNPMIKQEPGVEHGFNQQSFHYLPHQDMPFDPMFLGAMHTPHRQSIYMPSHHTYAGLPINLGRGGGTIPPFLHQNMVGGGYQNPAYGASHMSMPSANGPPSNFGMLAHVSQPPQSPLGFNMYGRPQILPHALELPPRGRAAPTKRQTQRRKPAEAVDEHDCGDEEESDDDEPLRTRIKRHPSATSDSVVGGLSPQMQPAKPPESSRAEDSSDVEFISSKSRPKKMPTKATKKAVTQPRALPQPAPPAKYTRRDSTSSTASINWTLPKYDVQTEPGKTKHDPTVAKISIPNLVREELLLSPDHAEQETHLLVNLFLPAQQALSQPDPAPAVAVLNFHTIAVMVIEAFVQYEIGDEFGTGRGHWHNAHDEGQEEYARLRNAKDADPDEIFFAVIDRWRAGLEAGKQPSKLIRGAQEFCDTALDLVYYIKENGLVRERQRAVRTDKGIKRGAKKIGEVDGEEDDGQADGNGAVKGTKGAKGVKRGAAVNTVEARKKPKTEKAKGKAAEKPKRKKKDNGPSITIIKR